MEFRRFLLITHRWLGLASAIVLVIAGVTGAILAWPGTFPTRRIAGVLHESLALGPVGAWTVLAATAAAVALQCSGFILWWRTRTIRVRTGSGWRRTAADLHHAMGVLGMALMLVLALTALGRVAGRVIDRSRQHENVHRFVSRLHTTTGYPLPVKLLFAAGSLGFAVQGVTGVAMWRRPRRKPHGTIRRQDADA